MNSINEETVVFLRRKNGYTQADVAAKLGIPLRVFKKKESKPHLFTMNEIVILADLFDVSINELGILKR